jgi:hypothetical protein
MGKGIIFLKIHLVNEEVKANIFQVLDTIFEKKN